MTPERFRQLALDLPGAEEGAHQGHADFRAGGKIFATLGPVETWGMVKLTPDEQERVCADDPEAFEPIPGAWGKQGCTRVRLAAVKVGAAREVLRAARARLP